MRFTLGPHTDDDVRHDVIVKLRTKGLDPDAHPALAKRMAAHRRIDIQRCERRRRAAALPEDNDKRAISRDGGGHFAWDPADQLEADERRDIVHAALARLTPSARRVVVLVDMESWSVNEVANYLEIPTDTVRSRLRRAHERLRQGLSCLVD